MSTVLRLRLGQPLDWKEPYQLCLQPTSIPNLHLLPHPTLPPVNLDLEPDLGRKEFCFEILLSTYIEWYEVKWSLKNACIIIYLSLILHSIRD